MKRREASNLPSFSEVCGQFSFNAGLTSDLQGLHNNACWLRFVGYDTTVINEDNEN